LSLAASIASVRFRIAAAARSAGRDPAAITLIAVSKTHPVEAVLAARAVGIADFGENRVQEASGKFAALRRTAPSLRLHLIGPLQTNKVRQAVSLADALHSLDRDRLAEALHESRARGGPCPDCFIQVNVGDEPQKAGIALADADRFIDACRTRWALPVVGLMCIPPVAGDPRPHFARLRDLAGRHGLPGLSMGMTQDFEAAIAEGATHVRIGSAIFGSRA
jgi:pyridoxal phosphate enzyme (YggS family)